MWAFRDMTRDTPAVLLVDDHDVYHPNVWGEAGQQCPAGVPTPWNYGGYMGTANFVNLVQRTQCSHNPDPYDPTPVERDISVYYGAFRYGGVDFAVLEDRKFKTAPLHGEDLNVHEPALLGRRQEAFLADWAEAGNGPKICLTQTCFASVQTSPQGRPLIDFDSNGYPKLERDRALELLREAGALVLAGDQHLASVVRHGLDDYDDGVVQFSGPAGGSFWQRWFEPAEPLPHGTGTPHTGDFKDAFGNKLRILAVANPKITFHEFRRHVEGRTQSVRAGPSAEERGVRAHPRGPRAGGVPHRVLALERRSEWPRRRAVCRLAHPAFLYRGGRTSLLTSDGRRSTTGGPVRWPCLGPGTNVPGRRSTG